MSGLLVTSPTGFPLALREEHPCEAKAVETVTQLTSRRPLGARLDRPLWRLTAMYSVGLATAYPAWRAFTNSMPALGLFLTGVSFLLMLSSFEIAAGDSTEDTF